MNLDYVATIRCEEDGAVDIDWSEVPSQIVCMEVYSDTGPSYFDFKTRDWSTIHSCDCCSSNEYSVIAGRYLNLGAFLEEVLDKQREFVWRDNTDYKEHTYYKVLADGDIFMALHVSGGVFVITPPCMPSQTRVHYHKELTVLKEINLHA